MTQPPFFVVGSVRSGTTLLRLMLGHHSEVCRCEEMEFVVGDIVDANTCNDASGYLHRLKLDRNFRGSGYCVDESLDYLSIAKDFLHQRARMDGKPRVGATVHHAFNDLPQIWPDAKFIFIRRDPRDVARSCVQMGWSGTPWHGVDFWLDAEQAWSRLQLNIPEHQCLVLRFEDLVADSPGQLSRICRFLDIDYESGMLDIDADTTYSRPDPAAAKSWQDSASVDEVQQVETRIGLDVLTECGYQPSGHPLLTGSADSLRIYCQELIGRVTGKVRLYGFSLWMRGVISRRLPFTAWRERVQIMVDEVDNQNLK